MSVLETRAQLAVEWELLHSNPAQGAKLPEVSQGRTRYLSPSELKAVLKAAPDWMRAPLALTALQGCDRVNSWACIGGTWTFPNRRAYLRETKNGSLRVNMLNQQAVQV